MLSTSQRYGPGGETVEEALEGVVAGHAAGQSQEAGKPVVAAGEGPDLLSGL
jgi:hypothetical protein